MPEALRLDRVRAGYGETVVLEDVGFELDGAQLARGARTERRGQDDAPRDDHGPHHVPFRRDGVPRPVARAVPAFERNRAGIGYVPQARDIFPSLSVEENLTVAGRPGRWTLERVYELFPRLAERRSHMGNQISGGEQQMLAIGRALMGNPSLLLHGRAARGARADHRRGAAEGDGAPDPRRGAHRRSRRAVGEARAAGDRERARAEPRAASSMPARAPRCSPIRIG